MMKLPFVPASLETNVCPQGKAEGQARNVSSLAQHSFYATRSDAGTLLNLFLNPPGKGVASKGAIMFSRSIRLFSIRFSLKFAFRVDRPTQPRYFILFRPVEQKSQTYGLLHSSGDDLNEMLKALPEVARSIGQQRKCDCLVGVFDADNDFQQMKHVAVEYHASEVVIQERITVSEIVNLK